MQPIKPHWAWFLSGPAILLIGGIAAIALMIGGISSVTEGMQRVDIPGSATIHIDKPGVYPIFYEQRGVSEANAPLALEVRILSKSGEPVPIDAGFANVTYNVNGVSGRRWGEANFPQAGDYEVSTNVPLGSSAGQLALGGNPGEKIAVSVVGFFVIGFGSFFLAAIIMLVVLLKRIGYRKRMIQQQYAAMPPMPNVPPPGATY